MNALQRLEQLKSNTSNLAQQQTQLINQQLDALMRETLLQNPKHILSKGYAIVRQQEHVFVQFIKLMSNNPFRLNYTMAYFQHNLRR